MTTPAKCCGFCNEKYDQWTCTNCSCDKHGIASLAGEIVASPQKKYFDHTYNQLQDNLDKSSKIPFTPANSAWKEEFIELWNEQHPELFQIVEFKSGAEFDWRDKIESFIHRIEQEAREDERGKSDTRIIDRLEDAVRALKRRADSSTYPYGQGESHALDEVLKLLDNVCIGSKSEGVD